MQRLRYAPRGSNQPHHSRAFMRAAIDLLSLRGRPRTSPLYARNLRFGDWQTGHA